MSSPQIEVVSAPAEPPFTSSLTDNDPVDVSLAKLKLRGQLRAAGIDIDITSAITDASGGTNSLTDSMIQAPTLQIAVLDRGYKALNSGVFGETVDVDVDGVPYRLMDVGPIDVNVLQLTFFHKIVALMLTHKKPLSASRATMTRAQFIELMLREIVDEFPDLIFVCPEVSKAQPVYSAKKSGRSLTAKSLGSTVSTHDPRGSGFGVSSLDIRDWDGSTVTLGPEQLRNASLVLNTCAQLKAPAKATLAVMEACLVEPDHPYENPPVESGSGGSAGILQWGGGGTHLPSWANDVVQSVTHSLQVNTLNSMQARRDADLIYSTAYEWHYVMPIQDAFKLGRPDHRINDAISLLIRDGWVKLTAVTGREFICLTNPAAAFGWETTST